MFARVQSRDKIAAPKYPANATAALTWTDDLTLQQARMDQTHREFVELLSELEAALAQAIAERWFDPETASARCAATTGAGRPDL